MCMHVCSRKHSLDCKTVGFFLKISKEIGKAWRTSLTRAMRASGRVRREKKKIFSVSPQSHSPFSASFQTFCLTARAYLNTQKYGLFCSLNTVSCWRYSIHETQFEYIFSYQAFTRNTLLCLVLVCVYSL